MKRRTVPRLCFGFLPKTTQGFSLVEISLALAIVAVAFVAMLGLVPSGLGSFRSAVNTQTTAEIFRRMSAELQETDFDLFFRPPPQGLHQSDGGVSFFALPLRYFDEQGQEVKVGNPVSPTQDELRRIVYTARTRGSKPGDPNPQNHTNSYFTSLPGVTAPRFNPRDSSFLTVQVVLNEGRDLSSVIDSSSYLVDSVKAAKVGMPTKTYGLYVTRNGYIAP